MSASTPFQSAPRHPAPAPFPTRGTPGGWRDPWDSDPLEAMVVALRQQRALRRQVSEAGVQFGLVARPRADGRWEAHVAATGGPRRDGRRLTVPRRPSRSMRWKRSCVS